MGVESAFKFVFRSSHVEVESLNDRNAWLQLIPITCLKSFNSTLLRVFGYEKFHNSSE